MKVLLFGHSYVRHLERLGQWDQEVTLNTGVKVDCNFLFKSFPGKDYKYFLDNPQEFDTIKLIDPDIIVVILGGNSINARFSNCKVNELAEGFFLKLKTVVRPDCIRLPVQIEPRFVGPNDRHGTPRALEFNRRRTVVNNFVCKKLKKRGLVDRTILLGSVNFLRDPNLFTDGVHLSNAGLKLYRKAVIGGIVYALENK